VLEVTETLAVIAFSLKDASDDDREEAMKKINAFMRMCWK
jgi:hypothetical protein